MSIAELKTRAHQKIEEADTEMLEWVLEVLGHEPSERNAYTDEDLAEFDNRVADVKSGKVKALSSKEFRLAIDDKIKL